MIKPFFLASLLTCLSITAKAGSGSITPAPANHHGIKGLLHFSINFKYVPTQTDLNNVYQMVNDANNIICDATDGQIVFGKVTLTAGSVLEAQGDIWIHAQLGRAGVSFFLNGSSLGTLGHHVNMFSNSLSGNVLAHELGHLALGLGDEYPECERKIGRGIEVNMPNHSLMEGRGSELTVSTNHDLNKGARLSCPSPGNPGCSDRTGVLDDAPLCESWDPTTKQYEATQQTLFHNGASDWETLLVNYPHLGLVMPNGLPQIGQPAFCGVFLNIVNQTHPSDAVVLVMDKSGSMSIKDVGSDETRLDFAKAAARVFLDLQKNRGLKVGLVSFNSEASQDAPLTLLTDQTQLGLQTPINRLTPTGTTAIGKAGLLAYGLLNPTTSVTNPTVFLLSDGENNVLPKPESVYPLLAQAGIRVFTVAIGNGADKTLLNNISHTTSGIYVGTDKAAELPLLYARMVVQYQGWSLPAQKQSDTLIENVLYSKLAMNIEKASQGELKFLISTDKPNETDYRPEYYFQTSGGGMEQIPESQITRDAFYMILNYGLPRDIRYELFVKKKVNGILTNPQMLCLRESSAADLFVGVHPQTTTNSRQPVMISPSVHYGKRLYDDKIGFVGKVIRPDGSEIPLQFKNDPMTQTIVAPFSEYNFKGTYKTVIEARIPLNAAFAPGESIFGGTEPETEYVPSFERQATADFFVQFGKTKCVNCDEPTQDCDFDGIRNDIENNLDSDKDGVPNRCDEDSDGDDIPDSKEGVQDNNNNGIPDYLDPDISILKTCNPKIYDLNLTVLPAHCKLSNGEIKATVRGGNLLEYNWYPNTHHHTATADSLSPALYNLTVVVDGHCILSKSAAVTCDVNKHKLSKSLETDYRIYPNPTTGQLNVEITDATILNIAIFNAVGTLVKNTSEQQSDFAVLQLADLPNGIYWVQVNTSKGSVMEKLLVQH